MNNILFRKARYFIFIFTLLICSKTSFTQTARFPLQNPFDVASILDTIVAKRMERYHIPGFAFSIVKDGKLFLSKGYGYGNVEQKIPVEADKTIFRIGSITKVFTATAIMQLVDEGKIHFNDDVNKFLSDKISYKNNIPVTLHHLLTHSTGFREIPGRRTTSADQILPLNNFFKGRLIQDHYAGEIANYGTYGIALSGLVLEKVSAIPYRDYIQKKIFDPLQMTRSNATDVSGKNKEYLAVGYEYSRNKFRPMAFEYYHTFPASDINSTVNDMANFMIMHLNNGKFDNSIILQPGSAFKMRSTQFRNHPDLVGYTYGMFESTIGGTKAVYHGGIMDGYASLMYLWPEYNIGLFLTCNTENQQFLNSVLNNFLYYFFPSPVPATTKTEGHLKTGLERFAGTYQRPAGPTVEIKLNPDSTLSFWGGKWLQVKPLVFKVINGVLDTGEDLIAFKEDENGKIKLMTTGQFVYFNSNQHKSKISFSKRELRDIVGTYVIDDSYSFEISSVNGKLMISVNNDAPSELVVKAKNMFFLAAYSATISFLNGGTGEIQMDSKTLKFKKKAENQ